LPPLALAHFAANSSTLGKASSFAVAFGGGALWGKDGAAQKAKTTEATAK
jgi:hypothetical protein